MMIIITISDASKMKELLAKVWETPTMETPNMKDGRQKREQGKEKERNINEMF